MRSRIILPLLMLLILPLAPALAGNQPNMRDFARVMPLTLSGSGALYELTLPQEVYIWSRQHDMGDVAVFNGQGEIVPFTLLTTIAVRTPQPGRELPLFPLSGPARQQQGDIALQVRTNEHGAIVNLSTAQGATTGGRVAGYIVDASALDQPVTGFDLVLTPGSKGHVGTLQVESSDDLQQWHSHASGAVATLSAGEQQLGRDRIEFPAISACYFRLSISPEQGISRIESVMARLELPLSTQKLEKMNVIIMPARERSGEYLARTSGHLPIDRLRLVFSDENSLARVTFLSRLDDKSPWIERGSGMFYRLRQDAGVVESAPLEIAPTSDEQWLIRVRQPGGGLGNSLPRLEVSWQPHRLVFAARGESPYFLAYGSARTGLDSLRDDGLELGLATWEQQRIKPLPALAGASQESGGRQAATPYSGSNLEKVVTMGSAAPGGAVAGKNGLATGAGDGIRWHTEKAIVMCSNCARTGAGRALMKIVPDRKQFPFFLLRCGVLIGLVTLGGCFMMSMPGKSHKGSLPSLTVEERRLAERLRADVTMLAGTIGERNTNRFSQLQQSAAYITDHLRGMGYAIHQEPYMADGKRVVNIEAELKGARQPDEIVVVGAHYDSPPESPGANDNASGVAALLELARRFKNTKPGRTLRFVAFVNEEPPFFQTGLMGSSVYAAGAKKRGEKIAAMLALETIGYYSDAPKSQQYPPPFSLLYPDTGNFIGFVGNLKSRSLVRTSIKIFRETTSFPSEGLAAPEFIKGIGWSDQWAFWQEGYPGIMVTDTAPFRYPHYHEASDTPEKLDYERMARVVSGIGRVMEGLVK